MRLSLPGAKRWRSSKRGRGEVQSAPLSPDYYPDEPGAVDCGRALEVVEYDGRQLGDRFRDLRSPAGDAVIWRHDGQPRGYPAFSGDTPLAALVIALRKAAAALRARPHQSPARHPAGDGQRLNCPHGHRSVRKGMTLRLNVNVLSLVEHQGAVTGVNIECDGQQETLQARAASCWPPAALPQESWRHATGRIPASITPCRRPAMMAPHSVLPAHSTPVKEPTCRPIFLGAGLGTTPRRRARRTLPAPGHRPGCRALSP